MKLLQFYKWFAGSQNDFTRQFQNNEQLFNQSKNFWHNLDVYMIIVFIAMLIIGIGMVVYYYSFYNNRPGRHYKPNKWLQYGVYVLIVTFVVSLGIEYLLCPPKLDGAFAIELKIALVNSVYACCVYFITSVIWCNWLPTNAYRIFKFSKK